MARPLGSLISSSASAPLLRKKVGRKAKEKEEVNVNEKEIKLEFLILGRSEIDDHD